jgi:nitrilase
VIVEPSEGNVIAGPLYGEEGILIADCDLRIGLRAKRLFDVVGHYGREDVLLPRLHASPPETDQAHEIGRPDRP